MAIPAGLIEVQGVPNHFIEQIWIRVRARNPNPEAPPSDAFIRLFNDVVRAVLYDNMPLPHIMDVSSMVMATLRFMLQENAEGEDQDLEYQYLGDENLEDEGRDPDDEARFQLLYRRAFGTPADVVAEEMVHALVYPYVGHEVDDEDDEDSDDEDLDHDDLEDASRRHAPRGTRESESFSSLTTQALLQQREARHLAGLETSEMDHEITRRIRRSPAAVVDIRALGYAMSNYFME